MKDFEKTETEVTLIHKFRMSEYPEDLQKVQVVFERKAYDSMEENTEHSTAYSMEDELDSRIYSYLNAKSNGMDSGGVSWNGIKSVAYLDEPMKPDRPILI